VYPRTEEKDSAGKVLRPPQHLFFEFFFVTLLAFYINLSHVSLFVTPIHGMGKRRGPKTLRFHALLDSLSAAVDQINDTRQRGKVNYSLNDCYRSARDVIDEHDYAPFIQVYRDWFQRLQRSKQLEHNFGHGKV